VVLDEPLAYDGTLGMEYRDRYAILLAFQVALLGGTGCDRLFGLTAVAPDAALPRPIARYPFDDIGQPHCAIDATGNGHDGTCVMGQPTLVDGRFGKAFHFDGSTRIAVPTSGLDMTRSFTVSSWVSLRVPPAQSYCIVNRIWGPDPTYMDSWQVCIASTRVFLVTSSAAVQADFPAPWPLNTWRHVALTWDGDVATTCSTADRAPV
jgi:hypothetical protein